MGRKQYPTFILENVLLREMKSVTRVRILEEKKRNGNKRSPNFLHESVIFYFCYFCEVLFYNQLV